jgi:hypothetical protein
MRRGKAHENLPIQLSPKIANLQLLHAVCHDKKDIKKIILYNYAKHNNFPSIA